VADLSDLQSAQTTKIVGADSTGTETNFLTIASNGGITINPPISGSGIVNGAVFTTNVETISILKTAYTEQTSNAQRSIASSSANDASAGTGARTVTLTYLTSTGDGPYTETITLNGVSYVNTSNSDICFIESIVVVTAGSGGSNAGTLTLKAAAAGAGATIATVTIGDNRTYWTQHYVPLGKTCYITDFHAAASLNAASAGALVWIEKFPLSGFRTPISGRHHFIGNIGSTIAQYTVPIAVEGPARLNVWATTEGTADNNLYASLIYFEL
jgi:hypothetical protein